MPLKIIIKQNLEFEKVPYALISQSNYGRMDLTTPCDGLATFGASSCIVMIGHCPELKRTVLLHTTNNMSVKLTLSPIFDWIIGKGDSAMYKISNKIEIAIFRGSAYNNPVEAALFNHDAFMNKFREFIGVKYSSQSVNIVDAEPLFKSSNGSLLVDKGTANITVLKSPINNSFENDQILLKYSQKQMNRDLFADVFPEPYANVRMQTNVILYIIDASVHTTAIECYNYLTSFTGHLHHLSSFAVRCEQVQSSCTYQ